MLARNLLGGLAICVVSCGGQTAPEPSTQSTSGHLAAAARLRAIPILGARLDAASELVPSAPGLTTRAGGTIAPVIPLTARAPLRVARDATRYLDVFSEHENDPRGALAARSMVYVDASRDTDAFLIAEPDRVEEIRVLKTPAAPTVARWRVRLGPGLTSLRVRDDLVEALDAEGRAWLRTEPVFAVDAAGRRITPRLRVTPVDGAFAIEASLDVTGLSYPIALDPGWGTTNAMSVARQGHTGVQLTDGRILVFGGMLSNVATTAYSTAEIYDPATGTWTSTGSMSAPRTWASGVRLADGKVMVLGGQSNASTCTYFSTSELWDSTTGVWTAGPALPRVWGTGRGGDGVAYALPGNKVATLLGGAACNVSYFDARVLDVAGGSWAASTNGVAGDTYGFETSLLLSGRILVTGGKPGAGAVVRGATTFDPTIMAFAPVGSMAVGRVGHAQVTLPSGKVLVMGGNNSSSGFESSAEIWDPATTTWSPAASMAVVKMSARAVVLSTGKVLIATGGFTGAVAPVPDAEIYDPTANAWSAAGKLAVARTFYPFFPLTAGSAIVIGGRPAATTTGTASVELMADGIVAGAKCLNGGACASGFCVDGVCCNETCVGKCQTCSASGTVGTCTSLSAPPAGKGVCDPYVCGAVDCKAACSVDTDCIASNYCDKTTSKCALRIDNGATCTTASQCKSGFCADGACCDKACDGACEACGESGSKGTCVKLDGVADKHAKCATGECASTCVAGACGFKAAVTPCGGASTCTGSTITTKGNCSGTDERCLPGGTAACPGSLICADAVGCKNKCSRDEDCTAGKCDLASGVCGAGVDAGVDSGPVDSGADLGVAASGTTLPEVPKVTGEFTRCNKSADCPSGHCVDGVCCDTACADKCNSCALLSSPGKCTVAPIGVDLRNECGPALQCLGTCDGKGQCIGSGKGTMCARNRCTTQGGGVGPAYCPGPGGKCDIDTVVPFDCGPFVCEPAFGACRTTCVSSLDCVNGFVCDLPSKTCVAPAPAADDEGGCTTGRSSTPTGAFVALLAALGMVVRRRR